MKMNDIYLASRESLACEGTGASVGGDDARGDVRTLPGNTKWLRETLVASRQTLLGLLEMTDQEISRIDEGALTMLWGELPSDYALELGAALVKMNGFLYAYCKNNWFDPLLLRRYQRKKKIRMMVGEACDVVRVRASDDCILVYMPYLPARQNPQEDFVNDLLCARLSVEKGLPSWREHHIAFHHVYPSETVHIPRDVDNYNYKRTIDLLELAMRHSDCAYTCSLDMRSHFTDKCPPGVYIEVTPKSSENDGFDISRFADLHAENDA